MQLIFLGWWAVGTHLPPRKSLQPCKSYLDPNSTELRGADMSCHDCLIWIGQTYPTVESFLEEAECRGCCREVSSWPDWVIPGATRVFLAHRDGTRRSDQGSIFGYFRLHSVGITLSEPDYRAYKRMSSSSSDNGRGAARFLEKRFKGNRLPVRPTETSGRGDTRDGSPDTKTDDLAEDILDTIREAIGETLEDAIAEAFTEEGDGSYRDKPLFRPVSDPDWRSAEGRAYALSVYQTELEEGRCCKPKRGGVRSKEKKVYFVDPLARAIDFLFRTALNKIYESVPRGNPQPLPEAEQAKLRAIAQRKKNGQIQRGIPEFQEAIEAAHDLVSGQIDPPPGLEGHAGLRGCVVEFERPYPIFRRLPSAAFRGIWRIDGGSLLDQVANLHAPAETDEEQEGTGSPAIRLVKVPNCDLMDPGREGKRTQAQLVAALSKELQVNQVFAREIFTAVEELIGRELRQRGAVTLPRVGTFVLRRKKDGDQVKFRPSIVLERNVSDPAAPQEG